MSNLTALQVKNAKPGRHSDGDGLYLVVDDKLNKKWVLRIQVNGKRRDVGLGSLKKVTLSDAREDADKMRKGFGRGEDPVADRKRAKISVPTFKEAAKAVHKENQPAWTNGKHVDQWIRTLEIYAFPKMGNLPVNQIDSAIIRDVLAEIWLVIPETARRVRQRIGSVLDYSHAKGWREFEAPMRSVSRGLPRQPDDDEHYEALPWPDIPSFFAGLSDMRAKEQTLLLLEFTILTAARSKESRGARWCEIDWQSKTWTVPPERMKRKKLHRVPLPARAMEILERMKEFRRSLKDDALIFEGMKAGKPMSDATLRGPLRKAGLTSQVHGFRSSFRDWAAEVTHFPRELAEKALAHKVKGKTEAAYQRGDLFDKRRELMDAWAGYCDSKRRPAGNVMQLRRVE